MKNVDKKINTLVGVINSLDPEKYFKFKFQDFCVDLFFSEDEGAFFVDEDFVVIWDKVDKSNVIKQGDNRDLFLHSFSFALFIFYAYVDFAMKTTYVSKRGMKRFCKKISKGYFAEGFPESIFEYYFYIKREGNSSLEQESIISTEAMFPFFSELSEFQFSFKSPLENPSEEEYGNIGESIKNAYMCYINTVCLSFSHFVNFLNSFAIVNEIS